MRILVAVVVSLVCILALILWLARSEPAGVVPIASAKDAATEPARLERGDEKLTAASDTQADERVPSVTQPASPTTAVAQGPRCRVFGRVLDESGAPLADAAVSIYPVGGRWSETATIEKTGSPGFEYERLKTTTAADGRFSFDAPMPTADWITLQVEADVYRSLFERTFGPAGGRNKPRLVEGDNDMGDIRLEACGAVSGRILDSAGAPIAKSNAAVADVTAGGRYSNATPDADGRFVVGHVPPGNRKLSASAQGWIEQRDIPVEVRANATTPMADIVLARAFSISGMVVDDAGAPVSRISIMARQAPGGGKMTRSGADGAFTLHLERNEPVSLEVRDPKGFQPWKSGPQETFAIGTTDVRIVLRRAPGFTFKVIDARTNKPIERFGIRIDPKPDPGSWNSNIEKDIQLEDHPGGEARLPVSGAWVIVCAPGHAPLETDVTPDAGTKDVQTLALRAGSSVRGRLVRDGSPVAHVPVSMWREGTDPNRRVVYHPGMQSGALKFDVGMFSGRKQSKSSGADGTFEIADLAPGTWMLQVEAPGAARKELRELAVPPEGTLDLGDVTLDAGATIRGVLVAGAGLSPKGYNVRLDSSIRTRGQRSGKGQQREIDDIDGEFEFTGLEAGVHDLTWSTPAQNSWNDDDPHEQQIELAAGETREVILDATAAAPCTVILHLTRDGKPAAGTKVDVRVRSRNSTSWRAWPLGTAGLDGKVEGQVDGDLVFDLEASSSTNAPIGMIAVGIKASPGGRIERTWEVALGRLIVELPATMTIPDPGVLSVGLKSMDGEIHGLRAVTPGAPNMYLSPTKWSGRTIDFGELAPGEYEGTVTVQRFEPNPDRPEWPKAVGVGEPYKTRVVIEADKETKIVVP